jgi:hypothetical protein
VAEKSNAWLSVSNDSANAAPIAATSTGWLARESRAPSQRPRTPTSRTPEPGVARTAASRLAKPSTSRVPIDTSTPDTSSHAGGCQRLAASATATPTRVTTRPWPSEKKTPVHGERFARVSPSIATR